MLDLATTTLWSCVWSEDINLQLRTLRVIDFCKAQANFGSVKFFTCNPPKLANDLTIEIPTLDAGGWNLFCNRIMPSFIDTEFALSVHEDGFILDPSMWDNEFLKYDFIGAPWRDGVVGNGGFCLESRRLLKSKQMLPFKTSEVTRLADYWLCRDNRSALESQGIKFAPVTVAERFSVETTNQRAKSFGFHGRRWNPFKYEIGWKLIEQHANQ